ncbi:isopentenyl-diphosphate delta-isomerase [Roseovarius nanhaiticus]|uniref:Isopentenyl-diphosphate Delta-isomerase n=1 Tax=Roseovarius nanhaiticus TaxID=573024 RepID=A0A1N7HGR8_9RHOB|nr:isopentenyl-diphosphate Delta-isomerase [Roseovarius nanhaiticus]SEK95721.1 isopentenyl-diphosphate delta-isomerase [Roseovarius nanhaiticus]SIS23992.1 isopentenyl-diphosphate delta-isomerase [Roseovarius nanhaiticus]
MSVMIPAWVGDTLTPVEKMDVHRRGLPHKAISVFVMRGTRTLIQRRALSKYHTPGLWANTCCTHPNWGETALDCAGRRLGEELGITGLSLRHRGRVSYRADVGGGLIEDERVEIYTADAPKSMPLVPNPDEVAEARWIDLAELSAEIAAAPQRFTPWLRIYLADHAEAIFAA